MRSVARETHNMYNSRDVVLGTRTRTRVQLEYKFKVLVLVLVLVHRVLVLVLVLVASVLVLVLVLVVYVLVYCGTLLIGSALYTVYLFPDTTNAAQSSSTTQCSLSAQLGKYLAIDCEYEASFDCFRFWQEHRRTLDKLYFPAIRALSVLYPHQARRLSVCSTKAG